MDHPLPDAPALPDETAEVDVPTTWVTLGFAPITDADNGVQGTVPEGILILAAASPDANQLLGSACQPITTSTPFVFELGGCTHYAYRLGEGVSVPETFELTDGVKALRTGMALALPATPPAAHKFPLLEQEAFITLSNARLDPVIDNSPLLQFSLRGKAEEFEQQVVKAKPLLGDLCLSGQATVWYAPPNAGKTLIVLKLLNDAVAEGRITPDNVYYINADDNSEGFATKIRLMDDLGVHTIAPGYQGFEAAMLPDLFHTMANRKKAKGALVIIDTIKKVASLMDKGKASAFTSACRSAVMAGATIVGFAHTNKQPQANGKLQYSGTTDLRDDFDAAYLMGPIETDGFEGDKVVAFDCIKSRGGNAKSAAYVYADAEGVSYAERLASVRLVENQELQGFRRVEEEKADADVVTTIETCIREGNYAKMALGREVAKRAGISERAAIRVIEKYTGRDPSIAKWHFQRKDRGAMIFQLHQPLPEAPPLAA